MGRPPTREHATARRTASCLHIIYSFQCSLMCGHCIYRCGPDPLPSMGFSRAEETLRQAARAGIRHIVFNGGEPFLHLSVLHDLVRCARDCRLRSTVVTSGSWALSLTHTFEQLAALKRSGMDSLTLSTDRYHLSFVPQGRVLNVLAAARRLALPVGVKISRLPWDPVADGLLRSVLRLAETVKVQEVTPLGRAETLRESLPLRPVFHLHRPGCRTPPVVLPDGRLLVCCNLPARDMDPESAPFILGNLHHEPLEELLERRRNDPLLCVLRREGPLRLYVPVLASAPSRAPRLPTRYHDGCDLCFHLFRHRWARKAAREFVRTTSRWKPGCHTGRGPRIREHSTGLPEAEPRLSEVLSSPLRSVS